MAMMVFRCDAMLMGVLLAIWSRHPSYQLARPTFLQKLPFRGALPLALILGCLALLGSDELRIASHRVSVIALLSVLLVWIASYNDNLFMPAPLRSLFVWLGARSYAIYLIHIPAFFLTRELWTRLNPGSIAGPEQFLPYLLVAGLLILVFSDINYRWVEQPLRRKGAAIADNILQNNEPAPPTTPLPSASPESGRREAC